VDVVSFRIVVDRDLCEGNARCVQFAPEVFQTDDKDQLVILIERPGEALREKVDAAVALCPRQALSIVDE
jgi:ferredoxin